MLKNLRLKAEALSELDLPIAVEAGLLGTLTLKASMHECRHPCLMAGRTWRFCANVHVWGEYGGLSACA